MEVVTTSLPRLNTPMYENLEANLPHMVMQFSDKPFPNGTQLFPTRETVMQYLEEYADEILPLTRLEHEVLDVKPTDCDGIHKWELVVRNNVKHKEITKIFDAVIVANGHCDWPLLPSIEGLEAWSRISPASLYHSTSYRNTKPFEDKVSKVLENSLASIRFEILDFAKSHCNTYSVSFLLAVDPLP